MKREAKYPLGHTKLEAKRLADQAAIVAEQTQDLLRRAGIGPGMTVLDVGCGVGDVSFLVARMVGREGSVLGIEQAANSVETARARAVEIGLDNVAFEQADLAKFATERRFDAIVGRFVLAYVPDRAAALRGLASLANPGGIIAFQEIDVVEIAQEPPSDLFTLARRCVVEAFTATGAEPAMGTRLYAAFVEAGLQPKLFAVTPVAGGPDCGGYEQTAQTLRSLLPVIEANGIATASELGLDTLAERLSADALANRRALFMSRIVGAWARLKP